MWENDFRAHSVEWHPISQGMTAAYLQGVQNVNIDLNPDIRRDVSMGSIFSRTATIERLAPVASLSMWDLTSALEEITLNGECIEADGTHPGLSYYFERRECKGPASGAVHMQYVVPSGIIVPQTLSVDHRGDAVLTYQTFARYDGTNKPVTIAHGQALPAITPGADRKYTMDKLALAGGLALDISGKRNISVDFNSDIVSEGADSTIYDTVQSLASLLSSMTVNGVDPQWLKADVTPDVANSVIDDITTGRSVAGTDTLTLYLKDRNQATTAPAHISLTMRGLIQANQIIGGATTAPVTTGFTVHTLEDGANAPIIAATGVVIP